MPSSKRNALLLCIVACSFFGYVAASVTSADSRIRLHVAPVCTNGTCSCPVASEGIYMGIPMYRGSDCSEEREEIKLGSVGRAFLQALTAGTMLVAICSGCFFLIHREKQYFVDRNGISFFNYVALGVMLVSAGMFATLGDPSSLNCRAHVALLVLGTGIISGALLGRMIGCMVDDGLVTDRAGWLVTIGTAVAFIVDLAVLIAFFARASPGLRVSIHDGDGSSSSSSSSSSSRWAFSLECSADQGPLFSGLFFGFKAILAATSLVLSIALLVRNLPDGSVLCFVSYQLSAAAAIAVPLLVLSPVEQVQLRMAGQVSVLGVTLSLALATLVGHAYCGIFWTVEEDGPAPKIDARLAAAAAASASPHRRGSVSTLGDRRGSMSATVRGSLDASSLAASLEQQRLAAEQLRADNLRMSREVSVLTAKLAAAERRLVTAGVLSEHESELVRAALEKTYLFRPPAATASASIAPSLLALACAPPALVTAQLPLPAALSSITSGQQQSVAPSEDSASLSLSLSLHSPSPLILPIPADLGAPTSSSSSSPSSPESPASDALALVVARNEGPGLSVSGPSSPLPASPESVPGSPLFASSVSVNPNAPPLSPSSGSEIELLVADVPHSEILAAVTEVD